MGGSNSTLSGSSFQSSLSNGSSEVSSCSDISSRTDGLLWDLEHDIHDGVTVKDFVQHVFHVTPEHINTILSQEWQLNPALLNQYVTALSGSLDANPSLAFRDLLTDFAQRVSNTTDNNFDAQTLSTHLQSTFPYATIPEIISMPPPDAVYIDLTDGESDNNGGSDTNSLDKPFTSNKPTLSKFLPRPVTASDLQLSAHAAEALNAPGCQYTTCIAVQSYVVTLWYYDRTCMIRAVEFDFRTQLKEFALVAYGISHKPKITSPTNCTAQHLPGNTLQSHFSTADAKITIRPDTSGQHDATFTIVDTIYTYHALIGRGTKVFAVTPDTSTGGSTDDQVLKLAWPTVSRPQETKLVQTIVAAAPQWQAHLPEITFSATFTADQLLPRLNLLRNLPSKTFQDRYLHVMAMQKYQKLWEVDNVDEFRDAFVDCVECHFHSYEEGKVLHCDLSENNLMCKRQCGEIRGVLNDWDMASPVDNNGNVSGSTKTYATGTIPFMAYDLLDDNPPTHLYRHDLESFMYILIWAAIHYDFTTKQKLSVAPSLAGWDHKSRRVARQAKGVFLFDSPSTSTIFQHVKPEFRHVLDEWIKPLHALFSSAMGSTSKDTRTCDGRITFQTFMRVLGRKPR